MIDRSDQLRKHALRVAAAGRRRNGDAATHRGGDRRIVVNQMGVVDVPRDLPMFYLAYFSCHGGRLRSPNHRRTERAHRLGAADLAAPRLYVQMFSAFFYLADWLPPPVRSVALYEPYTQAYEMIRAVYSVP